jgi:hypothetical protein
MMYDQFFYVKLANRVYSPDAFETIPTKCSMVGVKVSKKREKMYGGET